jgi:hypothetical protein
MQGEIFAVFISASFVAIAMFLFKSTLSWLLENKGFLGIQVVGWAITVIMFWQPHVIADYFSVTRSEIIFFAIIVALVMILLLLYRYRKITGGTAKGSFRVVKYINKKKSNRGE